MSVSSVAALRGLAAELCYAATAPNGASDTSPPLLVLNLCNLPSPDDVDYDDLECAVLEIVDRHTFDRANALIEPAFRKQVCLPYELVVFCAGGTTRPSWPWLISAFAALERKYKKGLQRLYLVHEKSFVRVALQLLEQAASPNLARKVKHLRTLGELSDILGPARMAGIHVEPVVRVHDLQVVAEWQHAERRKNKTRRVITSKAPVATSRAVSESAATLQNPLLIANTAPPAMPKRPLLARLGSSDPLLLATAVMRDVPLQLPLVPAARSQQRQEAQRSLSASSAPAFTLSDKTNANPSIETLALAQQIAKPVVPAGRSQQRQKRENIPTAQASTTSSRPHSASSNLPLVIHEDAHCALPIVPCKVPRKTLLKNVVRAATVPVNATSAAAQAMPLRRAISGPLTPSQNATQTFLPKEDTSLALPALKGQLKPTARRPASPRKPTSDMPVPGKLGASGHGGRVGNLRALFEERAKVARQMSQT